ncbi:MAG: outer membrane protein transport protein [Pseudomonadota bacterium]|nr:outer membrane protein transport protein [Pseudomonadota bacterium]
MAKRAIDKLPTCLVLVVLTVTNAAHGAGFYSPSVGTPGSLGTAGVANPTNTRGADAAWTNPAGMTGIDQQHLIAGFQVIAPSVKFNATSARNNAVLPQRLGPVQGDNGGNAAQIAPVPSFFYVRPLSDRLRFGLASTAPLGGGMDYGKDFVGRYAIQDVTLAGLALTPSLAYRLTDQLSIGAGASVVYSALSQTVAIRQGAPNPALDGRVKFEDLEDWGVQAILGLTYAFSEDLLLGIVYRSAMDLNLEGNVKYEGLRNPQLATALPQDVKISWTNPQWLEAGLRYRLDDKTQLYVNAGWQEWSKFSKNELGFRNDRVIVSDRNWDDTWHAGVAAVRPLSEKSFVSVGVSYESSPVKDAYRTLDFPVDEQWKLSASYAWKQKDNLAFSLGATLIFVGDAALEQTAQRVTVRGDYDTNMLAIFGGTLRYNF